MREVLGFGRLTNVLFHTEDTEGQRRVTEPDRAPRCSLRAPSVLLRVLRVKTE